MCIAVIGAPLRRDTQEDGRIRYWGAVTDRRGGSSVYYGSSPSMMERRSTTPSSTGISGRIKYIKLHYYPETDSLYIGLKPKPGTETREVAEGLNIDLDANGDIVGFDIDHASRRLDLSTLETIALPVAPRVA